MHLTSIRTVGFLIVSFLYLSVFGSYANAQETTFRDQAWRFGLHAAYNHNMASVGQQDLHEPYPNFASEEMINGTGMGEYAGFTIEYLSDSWWGVQLRGSWDVRNALIVDNMANPETEFDTRWSYLSFEPLLRIDQKMIPKLHFTIGGIVATYIHGTYDFKANKDGPVTDADVTTPDRNVASLGVSGGLGYDFEISRSTNSSTFITPFVDYSWIGAQRKSVITHDQNSFEDIWSTQTFRFGVRVSWEMRYPEIAEEYPTPQRQNISKVPLENVVVAVMPNGNTLLTKDVEGYFPITPYVFFDKGNTNIPTRYTMLSKSESNNFSEVELGDYTEGDETKRDMNIDELMSAYYNIMNIYAERMRKNPNTRLTLVGSDPLHKDGTTYANNVKSYFVDIWGIDANRIKVDSETPDDPSGSRLTDPQFASQIDDENRRVSFEFSEPNMYQPVGYSIVDESSIDTDILINIRQNVKLQSWNVFVTSEQKTHKYGPFYGHHQRINPAPLMRGRYQGNYKANVIINTLDGKQITEDFDFNLYRDKTMANASRYLMIFDYNKSDAVATYETKLRNEITPKIESGNRVIIHGHTDNIGNRDANQKLSQERAEEAKGIVDNELGMNHKNVNVQAHGIGQMQTQYTFSNQYPEGRMYNRNVFVEVIR